MLSEKKSAVVNPTPEEIANARNSVVLTQTEAARLIHAALISWQQWEAGARKMHPAFWELFKVKIDALRANIPNNARTLAPYKKHRTKKET